MLVTFISQCEKKARARSRRILDSFANRIGSNAWQTTITREGLKVVERQLRASATKNSAVCCHWHRSRARTDVLWIVGNRRKFDERGRVPVNRTAANLLKSEWENQWVHGASLQIAATLAALLHDIGKATVGFQAKLSPGQTPKWGDPLRHEWISLHLFVLLIGDCESDRDWLQRCVDLPRYFKTLDDMTDLMVWVEKAPCRIDISKLPPLAQIVAWLIVTHHRLPFFETQYWNSKERRRKRKDPEHLQDDVVQTLRSVRPVNGWVLNQKAWDQNVDSDAYRRLQGAIFQSSSWQKALSRWCRKALHHTPLLQAASELRSDPWFMHLARMCLILGDHTFSSLSKAESDREVQGEPAANQPLWANTAKDEHGRKVPKQALDQHLLGVTKKTARIARALPRLRDHLPALDAHQHSKFKQRTNAAAFNWQNKAYDLGVKHRDQANEQGFFGVNMASTGFGKTLGNGRIMYALADQDRGVRFTVAQGLRVLTVQTGEALRDRLHLSDDALAVLVGGSSQRASSDDRSETDFSLTEESGSESEEDFITEEIYPPDLADLEDLLPTVLSNPKSRKLVGTPIVSCTIDHMVLATENLRGGRHIGPMLRLLTSDLILDEIDDFDQWDLPAAARLVNFAGMLGSKVLVSSATLTPDHLAGLFQAYREGRKRWQLQTTSGTLGREPNIVCAWFDEDRVSAKTCAEDGAFEAAHHDFAKKRAARLLAKAPRRSAELIEFDLASARENQVLDWNGLATGLLSSAFKLHQRYHDSDGDRTASVGLIRFANIQPLIQTVLACYQLEDCLPQVQFHICCYHSQHLLAQRSAIEESLDRVLQRSGDHSLFSEPLIYQSIGESKRQHHVFVVAATAVAEVGRDHDYDWSIIDPSSMRSIIQLVGRVWRHRPSKTLCQPNVRILNKNIKAMIKGPGLGANQEPVFEKPGFEMKDGFLLASHRMSELLSEDVLANLNAVPRIVRNDPLQPAERLVDLEHSVMKAFFNSNEINFVNAFWHPMTANTLTAHAQRLTPFRDESQKQIEFVCQLLSQDNDQLAFYRARDRKKIGDLAPEVSELFRQESQLLEGSGVSPWINVRLSDALYRLSGKYDGANLNSLALKFATVVLNERPDSGSAQWFYHPHLGFWV